MIADEKIVNRGIWAYVRGEVCFGLERVARNNAPLSEQSSAISRG